MKRTPLILASLLILSSASAFADRGGERMHYYYEKLHLAQQKANGFAIKNIELPVPYDPTAQMTESYKPK